MNSSGTSSRYWDERAAQHGHTGWADPIVYAFDQCARLDVVRSVLEKVRGERGLALDFGTGSGDFAGLLSEHFQRVIATDISSQVLQISRHRLRRQHNIDFVHATDASQIELGGASLDLVLSVTVLGHVISDADLHTTLRVFATKLKLQAHIIALENTEGDRDPTTSEYQRFRSIDSWVAAFNRAGFVLESRHGVVHPLQSRCEAFARYRDDLAVRLLRRLSRIAAIGRTERWYRGRAKACLAKWPDHWWPGQDDDPLSVMVFRNDSGKAPGAS